MFYKVNGKKFYIDDEDFYYWVNFQFGMLKPEFDLHPEGVKEGIKKQFFEEMTKHE